MSHSALYNIHTEKLSYARYTNIKYGIKLHHFSIGTPIVKKNALLVSLLLFPKNSFFFTRGLYCSGICI